MNMRVRILFFVSLFLGLLLAAQGAEAYTVMCRDGTYSQAGGKQGACSHHGGVAGPGSAPVAPVTPPVDNFPPTITAPPFAGATVVVTGQEIVPPTITISDDVSWDAAGSYSVTVTWGDGLNDVVPFTGALAASIGSQVVLPSHTYAAAGQYTASVSITDPAGHAATATLLTVQTLVPVAQAAGYPRVVGTPKVSRTLSCRTGPVAGTSPTVAISWLRNGRILSGKTGSRYVVARRDAGKRLACRVLVSNAASRVEATSASVRVSARK